MDITLSLIQNVYLVITFTCNRDTTYMKYIDEKAGASILGNYSSVDGKAIDLQ